MYFWKKATVEGFSTEFQLQELSTQRRQRSDSKAVCVSPLKRGFVEMVNVDCRAFLVGGSGCSDGAGVDAGVEEPLAEAEVDAEVDAALEPLLALRSANSFLARSFTGSTTWTHLLRCLSMSSGEPTIGLIPASAKPENENDSRDKKLSTHLQLQAQPHLEA